MTWSRIFIAFVSAVLAVPVASGAESVSFHHEIVPILTKLGCNGGGCHGKTGGQKGFALSLFGFEPADDFEALVKESHGRRIFPAAPEQSLLLRKAAGQVPHAGGKRLDVGSTEYEILLKWIQQGTPPSPKKEAVVERIEIAPTKAVLHRQATRQLNLVAHLSDGSTRDITHLARFDSNNPEFAEVEPGGLVKAKSKSGSVGVMARYQTFAVAFEAIIPLGKAVGDLPPPRNFIDEIVAARWKQLGLPPSREADDMAVLRRATIDIAGRLPTLKEAEAFLANKNADRLDRAIDALLASEDYAYNFANKWSALLRNRRKEKTDDARPSIAFHAWIKDSLHANKPYDAFVREIVTATGKSFDSPTVVWYRDVATMTEQAEDTAQLFLGQRITCAKCHHHPLEKWSQDDYYRFAAFFARVESKVHVPPKAKAPKSKDKKDAPPPEPALPTYVEVQFKKGAASAQNPKTKVQLTPSGLDGPALKIPADADPREKLVDWMVAPENPYFARVLVNRYWKHFFGRGLVDPEDDLRITNPATNAELLDALANHFRTSKYDLKDLIRVMVSSRTYRLESDPGADNRDDAQNFSRFLSRRLGAETLHDAVDDVLGAKGTRAIRLPDNQTTSYFLTVFGRPDFSTACECERSSDVTLSQVLHLTNSKELLEKISKGRTATLVKDNRPHAAKLRELYLTAFTRLPTEQETAFLEGYIARHGANVAAAYEDIVWSVINSKEFLFNH